MEGRYSVNRTEVGHDFEGIKTIAAVTLGGAAITLSCLISNSLVPVLAGGALCSLIVLNKRIGCREKVVEDRVAHSLRRALSAGSIASRRHSAHRLAVVRKHSAIRRVTHRPGLRVRRTPLDVLRRPLRSVLAAAVQSVIVRNAA